MSNSSLSSSTSSSPTMQHEQTLQTYTTELVHALADLKDKRDSISQQIRKEEEEHTRLQQEAKALQDRLTKVEASLNSKLQTRNEYDRTIGEAEAAYTKIVESSQTLLHVLKRESNHLLGQSQGGQRGVYALSRSMEKKADVHMSSAN